MQAAEKLAAGGAYTDSDYVLVDEVGGPWLPDKVRRYMDGLMKQVGVTCVTPYEAMQHAAGSRMARAGVFGHLIEDPRDRCDIESVTRSRDTTALS